MNLLDLFILMRGLSDTHQPWKTSFKASNNETNEFESFKLIQIKELALLAKQIKDTMRF